MHSESKSEERAIVWAHRACGGWSKDDGDGVNKRAVFFLEFAQRLVIAQENEVSWMSESDAKKIFDTGSLVIPKKEVDATVRKTIRWWQKESGGDSEPAWVTSMRDAKRTIEKPLLFFCHVSSMGHYYGKPGLFSRESERLCCERWPSAAAEMILSKNIIPMVDSLPKVHVASAAWIPYGSPGPTHQQCIRFRRQFRSLMNSGRASIEEIPLPWTLSDDP